MISECIGEINYKICVKSCDQSLKFPSLLTFVIVYRSFDEPGNALNIKTSVQLENKTLWHVISIIAVFCSK